MGLSSVIGRFGRKMLLPIRPFPIRKVAWIGSTHILQSIRFFSSLLSKTSSEGGKRAICSKIDVSGLNINLRTRCFLKLKFVRNSKSITIHLQRIQPCPHLSSQPVSDGLSHAQALLSQLSRIPALPLGSRHASQSKDGHRQVLLTDTGGAVPHLAKPGGSLQPLGLLQVQFTPAIENSAQEAVPMVGGC